MKSTPSVYLDVTEYERMLATGDEPRTWCTEVSGYWVQIVPAIVYELEYRGLMTQDEAMSIYIEINLDVEQGS